MNISLYSIELKVWGLQKAFSPDKLQQSEELTSLLTFVLTRETDY